MKTILVITFAISIASSASFHNRIIGGQIAENGQFPYEVSLRRSGRHLCGGSIIDDQWILTAGHCVAGFDVSRLTVVTGINTLSQQGDTYQVEKTIYHEDYGVDENAAVNDIGVIKLKSKISFNAKVKKIPLNTVPVPEKADLVISGWGITSWPSNVPSNVLKFLKLKAVGLPECQKRFDEDGFEIHIPDTQLCALARDGEGACSGDSGSPLAYYGKVAGIASWVIPCGIGYPDVYTNVEKFTDWIEKQLKNN